MKHSLSGRSAAALLCAVALLGCDSSDNPKEAEAATSDDDSADTDSESAGSDTSSAAAEPEAETELGTETAPQTEPEPNVSSETTPSESTAGTEPTGNTEPEPTNSTSEPEPIATPEPEAPAPDPIPYTPQPGSCGLDTPAFCDTFENGPDNGGRSGELNDQWWSTLRGMPSYHANFDEAFSISPSWIPDCRADLSNVLVSVEQDTLICDPTSSIATRHLLTAAGAQNYGLSSYRIRQPFDFAERTGHIVLDADLSANVLGGWAAIVLSQEPTPAPSFNFPERGSGPQHGVSIEFYLGGCNIPNTIRPLIYSFDNFVETTPPTDDCTLPYVVTAPGALNHIEIRVAQNSLEVWVSDASPDGVTFPNFQRLSVSDLSLPFSRGFLSLVVRNHATVKYWAGASWPVRWDNVGFDGPVIGGWREHSAPESLTPRDTTADGCSIDGQCLWRGEVITNFPDDMSVCATSCSFEAEMLNTGYVIPNEDEEPVSIPLPGVNLSGATAARLVLAVDYPWFEWGDIFPPPTAFNVRYRLNGGPLHDHFVSEDEVNAFAGTPNDEGPGAGLLNQIIDLDLSELQDGDNTLELISSGTWTGSYRLATVGIDLVLTTE